MKTITLADKDYHLIENAREISGKRMLEFDSYHLRMLIGYNAEHVVQSLKLFNDRFNIDSMSECHLALNNALLTANGILSRRNATHYAFACLLLSKEEFSDQSNDNYLSESYMDGKVKLILDSGMSHIDMRLHVENFIRALLTS